MTNSFHINYPNVDAFEKGLRRLDELAIEKRADSEDDPIILASIGWRNGSTMLQRVLMTDPNLLMWGEPMDRSLFAGHIMEALSAAREDWPAPEDWISHRPNVNLQSDWVANLAPDGAYLKNGLVNFYDSWLAKSARDRGFKRWGVKEVRLTGQDGQVLRWLYPKSKFILLMRHPAASYSSLAQYNLRPGWGMWVRWPDRFVDSLESYAEFWNGMALSWGSVADRLGAKIVRYEDVMSGAIDLRALGADLGLSLTPSVAQEKKVGETAYIRTITDEERERIDQLTAAGRSVFGYL